MTARLDVVLCGSAGYTALWSKSVLEGTRVMTWRARIRPDRVQQHGRCNRLVTRREAARGKQCQNCKVAYCAHCRGAADIGECCCDRAMCERCREDCRADYYC
jgi:hypothetical protein